MKKLLPALLILLSLAVCAQQTTRKGIKAAPGTSTHAATSDSKIIVSPEAHLVDLNGYDKPLRSHRETFFATNNSKDTIVGIAFTITYFDTSNRQLHKAHHRSATELPAGETRQMAVRSWDTQQSFYYVKSAVPVRASQATPFDIKIEIDTLYIR